MKYTIYKITNILNGKIYIGKHQTINPNDKYYGSGKAILNAIKIYGKENFIKEVLYVFDTEMEMNLKEKELINEDFVSRTDTYNMGVGGEGGPHFKGKVCSVEHREKISISNKGRQCSNETREKLSIAHTGKIMSDESKNRMKISATGRKLSEETKNKIKNKRKLQIFSEETKEKMRLSALKRHSKKD